MYFYGKGTDVNEELGKKWIARAAAQGNGTALEAYQAILSQEQTGSNIVRKPAASPTPKPILPLNNATPAPTRTQAPILPVIKTREYSKIEQQILRTAKNHYAIQLVDQPSAEAAKSFIMSNHLSEKGMYFRRTIKDHTDYVVIMGNYPTHTAAIAAMNKLPAALKHNHPWVRSYSEIQIQMH